MVALQRPEIRLMAGIVLTILLVFIGDIMTPLGYAEAILYLVPLLLSSFLYNPHLPIRIAGLATLLVAVGFVLSPPGAPVAYALLNRTMVAIVLWTVAFGLRQLIRDRQTHLHEEQRWRLLAHQTNDILWDWDVRTNAHWWSDNAKATFGMTRCGNRRSTPGTRGSIPMTTPASRHQSRRRSPPTGPAGRRNTNFAYTTTPTTRFLTVALSYEMSPGRPSG